MVKRILLSAVVLLLMANLAAFAQADLERTENQMKSAIQREDQAQRKVESWTADKEDLVSEIRTLQTTNTWLDYQIQKYSLYIDRLKRLCYDPFRQLLFQSSHLRLNPMSKYHNC